jgi:dTDP-4-dehydrorhamnose reductase
MTRIAVTGANGRLGKALLRELADTAEVIPLIGESGTEGIHLDISRYDEVAALLGRLRPDVVIHTAAWTDVDGCARDPLRAMRINGLGAQYVAAASASAGALMVHISTNEVFSGSSGHAWQEYDRTAPINPYAYSKWAAEQAIVRVNPRHMIVRTAWLFAHGGRNFVQTILNAALAGRALRVVCDEVSNPTYTDDLAAAIVRLLKTDCPGTYHLVNDGWASRYEFARAILDLAGLSQTPIERISMKEWQRPSTPPAFAPLANIAAANLGVVLRPWRDALAEFLRKERELHAE